MTFTVRGHYELAVVPGPLLRRTAAIAILGAPLAVSGIAFAPIIHNYFFADDFWGLYRIVNDPPWRFLLEPEGGHLYFLRNAIFYGSYQLFGDQPQYYFGTVLLTHLVNVFLLFQLIRRVVGSPRLACFGASLWGVSPTNEGALGWYAVYGQVLATTLVVGAVLLLARRLRAGLPLGWKTLAACWMLLVAASGSFGVGIAVALVFPAVVALLAGRAGLRRSGWLVALAIPASVVALYLAHQQYQVSVYGRHLTEIPLGQAASSPVLVARMLVQLLGFGISSLMVGIATWPLPYPGALAYVAITIFAAGMMLPLIFSTRPERGALLAFALLAVATYGIIAAARASLYPSIAVPLETAAAVPRYHYLGPVWLCVMWCLALGRLAVWSGFRRLPSGVLLAGWIGFAAVAARANGHAIDQHVEARRETERVLGAIRTEIVSSPPGEPVFITNRSFQPAGFIPMPDGSPFPGWVAVFEIFFPENTVDGRRVFFVSDGSARTQARTGRITSLLVGADGRSG